MNYQEATMWLNVATVVIVTVGGVAIVRKINGKTCNPVKAMRQLFGRKSKIKADTNQTKTVAPVVEVGTQRELYSKSNCISGATDLIKPQIADKPKP